MWKLNGEVWSVRDLKQLNKIVSRIIVRNLPHFSEMFKHMFYPQAVRLINMGGKQ